MLSTYESSTHELLTVPPIPPHEYEEVNSDSEYCTTWPVEKNVSYVSERKHLDDKIALDSWAPKDGWKKPAGIKVIGVIFCSCIFIFALARDLYS